MLRYKTTTVYVAIGNSNRGIRKGRGEGDTLAYLIGRRAASHTVVVKGHRRSCFQWVSVKPMCHPEDKDNDLRITPVASY